MEELAKPDLPQRNGYTSLEQWLHSNLFPPVTFKKNNNVYLTRALAQSTMTEKQEKSKKNTWNFPLCLSGVWRRTIYKKGEKNLFLGI